jgi:hypothetical protein
VGENSRCQLKEARKPARSTQLSPPVSERNTALRSVSRRITHVPGITALNWSTTDLRGSAAFAADAAIDKQIVIGFSVSLLIARALFPRRCP